jgi:hypothetical protein
MPNKKIAAVIIDTYAMTNFARRAINETLKFDRISNVYTFGTQPIIQGETFYKIDQIESLAAYNDFIINVLPCFDLGEDLLVIQWDGYVKNPNYWREEFLSYDYIGAPWVSRNGDVSVGNGGFSFRSKKFLKSGKRLKIVPAEGGVETDAEDVLLCKTHRSEMEAMGISFAPSHVAAKFSYEAPRVEETFGFHGAFNLPFELDETFLIENIDELLLRISGEKIMAITIHNAIASQKLEFATLLLNKLRNSPGRLIKINYALDSFGLSNISKLLV